MNHRKICFITCVNDYEMYNESLKYIHSLYLPAEFEIETLAIDSAKSMTSGYNDAMKKTDAKYKIYLHQDVFIINKNFIFDILNIFKSDDKIGILGVAGANTIPTNAEWWESAHRFGKSYENHSGIMKLLEFDKVENDFQEVKALDGLLLATQYDIPWREDIFNGWHFYDLSQCVEFALKGYKAGVPRQDEPWCIHDCGFVETTGNYEIFKEVFLDEYSKDIFPLVSILIPTHNRPRYLEIALKSALNQTYKNVEIIVCDDSDNEDSKSAMQKYLNIDCIKYYYDKSLGVKDKGRFMHQEAKGEFINWLFDDDIFYENKIEKMMNYFIEHTDISLVTSHRQPIGKSGESLKGIQATERLFESDSIVDGHILGNFIIKNQMNIIGEHTTVLYRKDEIKFPPTYLNRQYKALGDVSLWLDIIKGRRCVYISETLSCFRIHEGQEQQKAETIINGVNDWFYSIYDSYSSKIYIESSEDYKEALINWLQKSVSAIKSVSNINKFNNTTVEEMYVNFKFALKEILFD